MRREKTIRVYEVLYHVPDGHPDDHGGAAGDGSFIYRTRSRTDAQRFATGRRAYQGPAVVESADVPASVARRWGLA